MKRSILFFALIMISMISLQAQHRADGGMHQGPKGDPIKAAFYPPEMIMKFSTDLNLTEEQKDFFKKLSTDSHTQFTNINWDLKEEMSKMEVIIGGEEVSLEEAKGQLKKVLELENKVKMIHLETAIKTKNQLTKEQRSFLDAKKAELHEKLRSHSKDRMGK